MVRSGPVRRQSKAGWGDGVRVGETRESEGKVSLESHTFGFWQGCVGGQSGKDEGFVELCTHCKFSCRRATGHGSGRLFAASDAEWSQSASSANRRLADGGRPAVASICARPNAIWCRLWRRATLSTTGPPYPN